MSANPLAAYGAYGKVATLALSGRAAEGKALSEAARLLERARTRPADPKALGDALAYNTKLWTVFQAEAVNPANPLPHGLKERILDLAGFMDSRTELLLGRFDAEVLAAMVEVNRSLASGLLNSQDR